MANGLAAILAARKAAIQSTPVATAEPTVRDQGQAADTTPQSGQHTEPAPGAKPNPFAKALAGALKPAPKVEEPTTGSVDSLDDLSNLDVSEFEETRAPVKMSQFADETPATAPTRELPDDLDKGQRAFVAQIDSVYELITDPELFGNVIRGIMIELKAHPQYMKLTTRDDIRTWVKGMRDNMGMARIKKQEAKAKRSGGSKKSAKVDDDIMSALDGLGVDFDNV